jgi:hypothetical protein
MPGNGERHCLSHLQPKAGERMAGAASPQRHDGLRHPTNFCAICTAFNAAPLRN